MADIVDPFKTRPELFSTPEEESTIVDPLAPTPSEPVVDQADATPRDDLADDLGSQYWEGMDFEDAIAEYKRIEALPNAERESISGMLRYTDTETGRSEFVPMPKPRMFQATGKAIMQAVQAPFSSEVSLRDAAETFTNPKAGTSGTELFSMGVRESFDDGREMVAGFMGNDEEVERLQREGANIDTEDSFIDSAIADGGPALAAAVVGDKGLSKVLPALKFVPQIAKNAARTITDGIAAVSTIGTEEGNIILGEDAAIPVWKGLDLGDSASNQVVEQRINALVEGIGITSLASGLLRTAADATSLVYDMTLRPIASVVGPGSNKEKVIFQDISNRLASITEATTEQERFEIVQSIANTIEENKDVVIRSLDSSGNDPVKLDTMNALIRGIDDPAMQSEARKVIAGMNTKAMPGFTQALDAPKQRLDTEIRDYLASVDAETPGAQTAAMQGTADEFTAQANEYVGQAQQAATKAEAEYNQALEQVGTGIAEDLEFADRLKQLETVTGTDIVSAKDGKLREVMDGVRLGYEDLSNQKNMLYNAIEGGDIDPDALFDKLFDLNDDQISAAMSQVRRSSPIKNMLDIVNTKTVPDIDPETGQEIMRAATDEERLQLFRDTLANQGADFGYIYNTIRPELSALASNLYSSNNPGAGKTVRELVRFIDEDMVTFVENSDPALAEAAREAKAFYKDTFAPIFGGEGVMADFAGLYTRTVGRTDATDLAAASQGREFDAAGFEQGAERIAKTTLGGGMVGDARQMMQALQVASDPSAMADYMVLDVLDKYAADIRINGLDSAKLTGMSGDLQQYASQLNELFPEKASQITQFVTQIEEAARTRGNLDGVIDGLEATVKSARDDIAQTELIGFLRTELGNDQFLPTSNPQAAFQQLFNSKEGVAAVGNINLSIQSLPPERAAMVRRGMDVAYMRQFKAKTSDFRREIGGTTPIKEVPMARAQQEFDNLLRVGREVFSDRPEVAEALEQFSEVAGFVQANKNARTNVGLSPTAFLQEASTATNRLIFTLIGPLSRTGTRVRAASSAIFQKLDPEQKAMQIYDEILSNPDKFVELSRKYNRQPNNKTNQDLLFRFMMDAGLKTAAGVDVEDRPDMVTRALDTVGSVATDVNDAATTVLSTPTVEEQTDEAFQ